MTVKAGHERVLARPMKFDDHNWQLCFRSPHPVLLPVGEGILASSAGITELARQNS